MKKILIFLILACIASVSPLSAVQQQPQAPQQPEQPQPEPETERPPQQPQQRVIQTPFGRKVVPIDTPATPVAPAEPAPAEEAPTGETPATPTVAEPPGEAPADPAADAAPEPAEPQQQVDPRADEPSPVALDLDNADIHQVIRIILDSLGLSYVIDPRVQGTVNIGTSNNLRRGDLLPILETILKINGATMVRNGNFYQIVPVDSAIRQPLEVQQAPPAPQLLDDQIVIQVVRMRYVPAAEMAQLLTPYLSEGGSITTQQSGNVLLIAERRSNIRKLLEIAQLFDSDIFADERVRMFQLENTDARNMVTDLQNVFAGYALSAASSAIRFVPMERINSVLVVTPNASVFPEVERWIERLDQPLATGGIRNFVYRVRNAKAADIQRVLADLYAVRSPVVAPPATAAPGQTQSGAPPTPPTTPGQQADVLEPTVFGRTRIIADTVNNALVIQTTPQEYAEIERTIRELDVTPRQVLIDAQIYEVTLDDSLALGLSATLQNRGTLGPAATTAQFSQPAGGGPASLVGQTFAFIGRTRELRVFLNATENRSRVRTLSAPSVLVSDNMPAQFQVGAEVPVPVSSSVTPIQSDGTNLFAQTIQFRNTGVILEVTPQINESGKVTLEISQEVSQAGANTVSAIVAPVIGKSSISSTIVVDDGQTVAIGGFIRENQELTRNRIPLLGRIPGLGILFGNTVNAKTRTELIILITPHVIRSESDADLATEELKSKLREIQRQIHP